MTRSNLYRVRRFGADQIRERKYGLYLLIKKKEEIFKFKTYYFCCEMEAIKAQNRSRFAMLDLEIFKRSVLFTHKLFDFRIL